MPLLFSYANLKQMITSTKLHQNIKKASKQTSIIFNRLQSLERTSLKAINKVNKTIKIVNKKLILSTM
jgi:hypothetical protein